MIAKEGIGKQTDRERRYSCRIRGHHGAVASLKKLGSLKSGVEEYISVLEPDSRRRVIYVHIPFCSKICTFCNMRRSLCLPPPDYHELLLREIINYSRHSYIRQGTYDAVYFGGGTPTSLDSGSLRRILEVLRDHLPLSEKAEITVESSVTELTEEKLEVFREYGVNRLSIGVQTFSERGRQVLGRRGTGEEAARKIKRLKELGFANTGVDIIYNYPEQTEEELEEDLRQLEELDAAGFSFYSLILHNRSALGRNLPQQGYYTREQEEKERYFFDRICGKFLGKKFTLLELTRLVQLELDSYRYIGIRYKNGDTLPLGAGAGGRIGNLLFQNPLDLSSYRSYVEVGGPHPLEGRLVDEFYNNIYRLVGEMQFGRLDFPGGFWPESEEPVKDILSSLVEDRLLARTSPGYELTLDGIYWGNNIADEIAARLVKRHMEGEF